MSASSFPWRASIKGTTMRREQLTEKILDIKREKGWTWRHITNAIGGIG
jgi:hypothetical protein